MGAWTGFADLFAQIEPFVRASVDAIIGALMGYVRPTLQWGLIAYLAGRMLWKAVNRDGEPLSEMEALLIKGAIALYVAANASAYTGTVRDLLLYGLPSEVNAAISGATGEPPITAAVFDDVWNKAWAAGAAIMRNLSWSDVTLSILVALFLVVAMLSVLAAFVIWLKAFIFLSLLVAVGPLFIGLFLFPVLRGLCRGWFAAVMSNVILQILTVAMLSILLGAETRLVAQIASLHRASGNVVAQAQLLFAMAAVFVCCGFLSVQLPGLANTISHGFASDAGFLGRWFGTPMPGGGGSAAPIAWRPQAPSGAGGPASATTPAAAAAPRMPPGPSLSNAAPPLNRSVMGGRPPPPDSPA